MPTYRTQDGADIYYESFGSGEEIVISAQQSFGGDSYQKRLAQTLPGYRVYEIQLRGYGKSTHVQEDLGTGWYRIWARDVAEFARQQGISRFIYTGNSHGAGVGWRLALDYPELLKAFVSVVGAPHDRAGGDVSPARQRTIDMADDPAALREMMDRAPAPKGYPTSSPDRLERRQRAHEDFKRFFLSMAPEELRINPRKPLPEAATNEELAELLGKVRTPTLMLAGLQDDIISAEMSLLAAKAVPYAKSVFYQDHGHSLASEAPDRVIDEIALFIAEINQHRWG
ncbi:alpha/beta fold hydrolase [Cohnella caldifontis]|uniref:alpha/beta fold hydrolase n=1 Tax=Cohnella caldifontis TaxID=3027471 RepID=UPI0023ED68BB|nr:alpha/beta hydrolase [Cohnella sp. YIM B05605]